MVEPHFDESKREAERATMLWSEVEVSPQAPTPLGSKKVMRPLMLTARGHRFAASWAGMPYATLARAVRAVRERNTLVKCIIAAFLSMRGAFRSDE